MREPRLLAGATLDVVIPMDSAGVRHAQVVTGARALRAPTPGGGATRASFRLGAVAGATRAALLLRFESDAAVALDVAALEARLAAHPPPERPLEALVLELREYSVDEEGRLHGWGVFDLPDAGGLVRAEALGALPGALVHGLAECVLPHIEACVRRAPGGARASEEWTSRPEVEWTGLRRVLLHGESLGVRLPRRTGIVTLGRLAPGAVPHGPFDAAVHVPLLAPSTSADVSVAPRTLVVPIDCGLVVVDLGVLGSLLHTPAFRGPLARWREAQSGAAPEGAAGELDALNAIVRALAVGACERRAPVTPGYYPPPIGAMLAAGPCGTGVESESPPVGEEPASPAGAGARSAPAPPGRFCDPGGEALHRGVFVACHATSDGAIVELAMLPFTHTGDGRVVAALADEAYAARGEVVDPKIAGAHLAGSGLVVAHGAARVRPLLERTVPAARTVRWACSQREVPWAEHGASDTALRSLATVAGAFEPGRHGALGQCLSAVRLLARTLAGARLPVLAALLARAGEEHVRLWPPDAPQEAHTLLRRRGYRWMTDDGWGVARAWWVDVAPERLENEWAWLREEVYRPFRNPLFLRTGPVIPGQVATRRISAFTRWRAHPADVD